MKTRFKYIDIARAFAIIFIVLGHTLVHSEHCSLIFKLIYSFHVVLFFILSGYTFKIKQEERFIKFVKNKFLRIMIPYFIWALLFLIPYLILGQNIGDSIGTTSSFNVKNQLINIVYGNGNASALKQNSSLWFLPALFSMEIIYYYIIKLIDKIKKIEIPILLSSIVICYITYYLPVILPWGINTALNLGIFFLAGYLFKKHNLFTKDKLFRLLYIIPIFIVGILACLINNKTVSCIDYAYGNFSLALLSGICLSCVVLYISFLINNNKILEYIGKNTMGILIFHKIIILIFQTKLGYVSKLLRSSNIFIELVLSVTITFISIGFSLLLNIITRKIIPLVLGEIHYNYK